MITSSTSSPCSPVRLTSSRITVDASAAAPTSRNTPPKRPTGVRRGWQITASLVAIMSGTIVLLYNSQVSGNCYKVRLLLAHLGRDYERRELDVIDRSNRAELLGELNPALRVPT